MDLNVLAAVWSPAGGQTWKVDSQGNAVLEVAGRDECAGIGVVNEKKHDFRAWVHLSGVAFHQDAAEALRQARDYALEALFGADGSLELRGRRFVPLPEGAPEPGTAESWKQFMWNTTRGSDRLFAEVFIAGKEVGFEPREGENLVEAAARLLQELREKRSP